MERYILLDKKIKVRILDKFIDRFKGYRMYLYPIKEGLC